MGGEDLLLPAGAIVYRLHFTCKTTFLINLALNVAQAYPEMRLIYSVMRRTAIVF
jgi:hypothetical protein